MLLFPGWSYLKQAMLLVLIITALAAAPATAAINGFVAGEDGMYYQYDYEELLDSYATMILGTPNGYYEHFASRPTHALFNQSSGYLDYFSLLDQYARSIVNARPFDLSAYIGGGEAVRARMPDTVRQVSLIDGRLFSREMATSGREAPREDDNPGERKTPLRGEAAVTLKEARNWAQSRGAHPRFLEIAEEYWRLGEETVFRPEVLYVQSAVETDFGHFSGVLFPAHNNWAGIKTAEGMGNHPDDYETFSSPEEGVRAHFNHLAAYAGEETLGEPHGRYHVVMAQKWAGEVHYVEELSGRWTAALDYHTFLLQLLDQLGALAPPGDGENNDEDGGDDDLRPEDPPAAPPGHNPGSGAGDSDNNPGAQVIVNTEILRLRDGPGTGHTILERLTRGTVLSVDDRNGEWLSATTPGGKKGWVHGAYVRPYESSGGGSSLAGRVVVIDAGHGGVDPGAIGITGLREKEVNLAVALRLKALLEQEGARVIMTRSGDQTLSSTRRAELANEAGGDIFISIHANSFHSSSANGTETFYTKNKSNSEKDRLLAGSLQRELIAALGRRDRGVKTADFIVLKNTKMPAALVELAFLSNREEEALLRKDEVRDRAAQALFRGIKAFFGHGN